MSGLSPNPSLVLALGPPGCGKTEYCLRRFLESPEDVLVVLPTNGHVDAAVARLRGWPNWTDIHEFHLDSVQDWQRFLAGVIDVSRGLPLLPASAMVRLVVVARVCQAQHSSYFGQVIGTRGFQRRLAELFEELDAAGLTPAELRKAAERVEVSDPRFVEKCHAIAALWEQYEQGLSSMRVRTLGAMTMAACDAVRLCGWKGLGEESRWGPGNGAPAEIWFDGFSWFDQAQVELLCALAEVCRVGATLSWSGTAPHIFARTKDLLNRLGERFEIVRVDLEPTQSQRRSQTMQCLRDSLFSESVRTSGWDEEVLFVSCPNRLSEVEWAARWVRKFVNEKSISENDIVLIARDIETYWPMLETVWPRFGLKAVHGIERPIRSNGFVRFLHSVLRLFAAGWRKNDLLAHISNSYAFGTEERMRLRAALAKCRGSGLEFWTARFVQLCEQGIQEASRLSELARWSRRFEKPALPSEFASHLRDMATAMGWSSSAAIGDTTRDDDFAATAAAYRLAETMGVVGRTHGEGPLRVGTFLDRWIGMTELVTYRVPVPPRGGIRVFIRAENVGRAPRLCVLLGVLEGVFPKRVSEHPFLSDEERLELRRKTGCHLVTGQERAEDEWRNFYLASTLATDTVMFFFPRSQEESESIPSLYLEEVRSSLPKGAVRDVLVATALPADPDTETQLAPSEGFAVTGEDRLLWAALLGSAQPPLQDWSALPRFPRIELPEAKVLVGRRPGPIPITELEALHRCAFRHWAEFRARLRGVGETISRAEQGSWLHSVLRDGLTAGDLERLAERLIEQLDLLLQEVESDCSEWELWALRSWAVVALTALAEREVAYRRNLAASPKLLEWRFGEPETDSTSSRQRDSLSTAEPLRLTDNGRSVTLAGSIDRVDEEPEGGVLVLDYKLGSADHRRVQELENGKSFQLLLYVLAVEQLLERKTPSVAYDGLTDGRRTILTRPAEQRKWRIPGAPFNIRSWPETQWKQALSEAKQKVFWLVDRLEKAVVSPSPTSEQCAVCAYGDLCRTRGEPKHDGEPFPEAPGA